MKQTLWKFAALSAAAISSTLLGAESNPAQTVKRELDANGLFYSYMDFEGGWSKVAGEVSQVLKDTPQKSRDYVALADALGLSAIRALGLSSTSVKGGYDNRIFLYAPSGRKGLLAVFPGEPAAFEGARYAPADADFFAEARLDATAVVGAALQIASSVSGNQEAGKLALDTLRNDPVGFGSLLNFKGRIVAVARLHSHEEIEKTKAEFSAKPPADIFVRAESGGSAILKALSKEDAWKREDRGGRVYFTSTKNDSEAVVIVEGETIAAGMPKVFVEECLTRKDGLAQSGAFKQALADTAQRGHAVVYVTPRLINETRDTVRSAIATDLPLALLGSSARGVLLTSQLLAALPVMTKPITSVIVARPDGLLVRERSIQSLKASFPITTLLTPDFLGQILRLTAHVYAINDAEGRAGEVVHEKISAEIDRAGEAANRYFASHAEESTVTLSTLREAMPEEKLPDFQETIASDIEFYRQSDKVELELKIGRNLTHILKLTPAQRTVIEANLQKLAEASVDYLIAGNSYPSPSSLVENEFLAEIDPLVGEDYDQLTLSLDTPTLTVTTPGGQEVTFTRDPLTVMQARHRHAERQIAVERNLAKIDAVAQQFFIVNPDESSVSFEQLAQNELVSGIDPVAGEDYSQDLAGIAKDQDKLSVSSKRFGTVTWIRPLSDTVQTQLVKSLTEIEQGAAEYFAKNPEATVVISGELLPPPAAKGPTTDASSAEETDSSSENAEQNLPDLTSLVIRRDYKSIKISLENGLEIEVPRSLSKK